MRKCVSILILSLFFSIKCVCMDGCDLRSLHDCMPHYVSRHEKVDAWQGFPDDDREVASEYDCKRAELFLAQPVVIRERERFVPSVINRADLGRIVAVPSAGELYWAMVKEVGGRMASLYFGVQADNNFSVRMTFPIGVKGFIFKLIRNVDEEADD